MTEAQTVQLTWAVVLAIGGIVAWGSCLYANHLDRKEGWLKSRGLGPTKPGEAPSILTAPAGVFGVIVLALLSSRVVQASQPYVDGCDLVDPSTLTWAQYLLWLAAGCFWL